MRPYLAILRDSLHEALASWLLWILLISTTVLLVALAPVGVTEEAASHLALGDLVDPLALIDRLAKRAQSEEPSPDRRVWTLLSDDLRRQIGRGPPQSGAERVLWQISERLREELNALLLRRDFYQDEAWRDVDLPNEAGELLAKGLAGLPDQDLARFNRLALEAAFPRAIAASGRKQVEFTYLFWSMGVLPVERNALRPTINFALSWFMYFLLGVGGLLAAILVTSGIIPHTFEPGAIDLLFSKPVSRSLVFLAKFAGGCAFLLINCVWLLGGLWLILGWRFGVWNHRLWLCIPLYLFLFAIYYGVSALAGLVGRNAIVAVVITVLFWAGCFGLGQVRERIEALVIDPNRLNRLMPAGDETFAVNEQGQVLRWVAARGEWEESFLPPGGPPQMPLGLNFRLPLAGPVYDARGQRLLAAGKPLGEFDLLSAKPLWAGRSQDRWLRVEEAAAPLATEELLVTRTGTVLAVSPLGLFRLDEKEFVSTGPDLLFRLPLSAALEPASGDVALFDGRQLVVLQPAPESGYQQRAALEEAADEPGLVALAGETLMLALESGEIRLYRRADLTLRRTIQPPRNVAPRSAAASPDGRWLAVVFHDRCLWLYDAQAGQVVDVRAAGQEDITAAAFDAEGRLLVADRLSRVTTYVLDGWHVARRAQPGATPFVQIYRYGILPLYTLLPKPAELNKVVDGVLSGSEAIAAPRTGGDLSEAREKVDYWVPLWSNLAFLAVVLACGCGYVARKDF